MWNVLDRFAESVRQYSTPIGQLWNTVTFVFRLFVVVAVGSSVYGDEQGAFKCDTGQPGCTNVCFNRFSPIGHMRFWAFQILFVSTPVVFFYLYAGMQTGEVKKLVVVEKELKEKRDKMDDAVKELNEISETPELDDRKSQVAFSNWGDTNAEVQEAEKKYQKLKKKVGHYKEKEINEIHKGGNLTNVIFTTRVRVWYIVHCLFKFAIEAVFLYLGYVLQYQQSRIWGSWKTWTVPEKYVCNHAQIFGAAGSACAQQEHVTCWVSRPFEKQFFLYYMLAMTIISMMLTILEALYMAFRTTKKGIQRRATKKLAGNMQNGWEASNMGHDYTMNTMMSQRHNMASLRKGLHAANTFRYASMKRPPYYPMEGRYTFAGQPLLDHYIADDGVPQYPISGRNTELSFKGKPRGQAMYNAAAQPPSASLDGSDEKATEKKE